MNMPPECDEKDNYPDCMSQIWTVYNKTINEYHTLCTKHVPIALNAAIDCTFIVYAAKDYSKKK